ncbi:MAG TPA: hypothetical protein VG817_10945 [Gemmatimonadales bacterium]|nr:hypothetical protein [Gemmatimonadales bacterium]
MPTPLTKLRQAVVSRGFTPATWTPVASEGRAEEATIQVADVMEPGRPLAGSPVGDPEECREPLAFLDGTQRYEVVGYAGVTPIVHATITAAVMIRQHRQLKVFARHERRLVVSREAVLDSLHDQLDGAVAVAIPDRNPPHVVGDLQLASREVDKYRGHLEVEAGIDFRRESNAWLVVDGSLGDSREWANDPRMIGVCKSHATLPFEGADLEAYLRILPGHRSPVFQPTGRRYFPVYSWALRLRKWEGKDLLHGLVRLEAAPIPETIASADQVSRWLLAERSPVSMPDPRWDRLLYGIRSVEQFLRATSER